MCISTFPAKIILPILITALKKSGPELRFISPVFITSIFSPVKTSVVKGKNKADVLARLYNNSRVQGFGAVHATPEKMTTAEAQKILDDGYTDFDYLKGRVMKVDLSGDDLDTYLYDRDNGSGAAAAALEA